MSKQTDRLLGYLKTRPDINPLESWRLLGIYRLAAVVFLLKKDGHNIVTHRVDVKNRYGETCNVARYELIQPIQKTLF